eukprot:c5209_g1_i1 orf=194-1309(+)
MASFVIEESEVQAMLASSAGLSMEALLSDLVVAAKKLARPPISRFYVGAVGLGASGRVFLGVNLEFAGVPLSNSVHAEQFLVANAAQHGEQMLCMVAVSAAPCGHCRQFLQELRGAPDLRILIADAAAETCTLAYFLPHHFGPNDVITGHFPLLLEPHCNRLSPQVSLALNNSQPASLQDTPHVISHDTRGHGTSGLAPRDTSIQDGSSFPAVTCSTANRAKGDWLGHGEIGFSAIEQHKSCMHKLLLDNSNPEEACSCMCSTETLQAAALEAANASHAPYTNCPSGVALLTKKGKIFSGSYMESVAYNPSLPPLQAALVAFVARDGGSYEDIVEAVLVEKEGAAVQFVDSAKLLLQKISQGCKFFVHYTS